MHQVGISNCCRGSISHAGEIWPLCGGGNKIAHGPTWSPSFTWQCGQHCGAHQALTALQKTLHNSTRLFTATRLTAQAPHSVAIQIVIVHLALQRTLQSLQKQLDGILRNCRTLCRATTLKLPSFTVQLMLTTLHKLIISDGVQQDCCATCEAQPDYLQLHLTLGTGCAAASSKYV